MLAGQDPAGMGAQLTHSGGRILTVEEVAAAAVDLVGSRRVVRTLRRGAGQWCADPRWRRGSGASGRALRGPGAMRRR